MRDLRQKMDLKQTEFRRQIDEKKQIYLQKVNLEIEKENEAFMLKKQETEQEKAQVLLDHQLFEAKEQLEFEQKLSQL